MTGHTVEVGLVGLVDAIVTDADTAVALGSGDVPVLGTPRLIALLEAAAVAALTGRIGAGSTSVGVHIDVAHLAATAVGHSVTASATVTAVDGRTVDFAVEAREGETLIARGIHRRVVVDRERFLASLG